MGLGSMSRTFSFSPPMMGIVLCFSGPINAANLNEISNPTHTILDSLVSSQGKDFEKIAKSNTSFEGADSIQDTRTKESIMSVVRAQTPGLRYMFTKYLRQQGGFGGKIVFRLEISPLGDVIRLDLVSSTTGNAEFDNEVRTQMKAWNFGHLPTAGKTTVTLPFTFEE